MNKDIPVISLQRLPIYLNYLKTLSSDEHYISSGFIAKALGMGEVLVRKDLAYTSAVGKPRSGYIKEELISAIEDYLCCNRKRSAVIVGIGALGRAILAYEGFTNYGIEIAYAFDSDKNKIGLEVAKKTIWDISDVKRKLKGQGVELAILCVPSSCAQSVADLLIDCGIRAILNFAPVSIKSPDSVIVRQIDVAANLAILSSMI